MSVEEKESVQERVRRLTFRSRGLWRPVPVLSYRRTQLIDAYRPGAMLINTWFVGRDPFRRIIK